MTRRVALAGVALAAAAAQGQPATSMTAGALHEACAAYQQEPQSEPGARCVSYLLGFVEGAAAVDPRVLGRSDAEGDREWLRRAARTRVGTRVYRDALRPEPEFCLEDPPPLAELARRVLRQLEETRPQAQSPALAVVRTVLRRDFPCPPGS